MSWLSRFQRGYDVTIEDSSYRFGALSLQGPNSRNILNAICGDDVSGLKYFRLMKTKIGSAEVVVSRTGYTGDLGYEVWAQSADALAVYDALLEGGAPFGMLPAGLRNGHHAHRGRLYLKRSGLLQRNALPDRVEEVFSLRARSRVDGASQPRFNGSEALKREKKHGPNRLLVGLELDWDEHEALFARHGLPPEISGAAWRDSIPVYDDTGTQVGYANSGSWSPTLKKNLALATVKRGFGDVGRKLQFEVTVEYERRTVTATVAKKPFYDPERKRA